MTPDKFVLGHTHISVAVSTPIWKHALIFALYKFVTVTDLGGKVFPLDGVV